MTGGLPRGLISIADNPTHETEQEDDDDHPRLDVATIAKTWRIYSASSNVLEADTGNRLENLFWRTWSNPDLLRNMHPSTFTNVVHHIGTGRGRVRSTRPSHFVTDLHAHDEDESTPVPSGPPTATASPVQPNSTAANTSEHPSHAGQSSSPSVKSPQSILKKPSTDHSYVEPKTEQASTSAPQSVQRDSIASSSSTTDNLSPASSERPRMKRQTSGGSKKTSFVATTSARAKARPSVPRRKSSQGTVPQARDKQKEPLRSPAKSPIKSPPQPQASSANEPLPQASAAERPRPGPMGPPPGLPLPASGASSAAFFLPSASSWQSVESTSPGRSGQESVVQNSISLVDPDFRKQFVEARSHSQINLAAAGSKMRKTGSVVRFAEDLPDLGKGKGKESTMALGRRGSGAEARRSSLSLNTPAIDDTEEGDSDEDGVSMLPRTKSQLSMAIEKRRRTSASQNLGSNPDEGTTQSKAKGKGKAKDTDKEKEDTEDELLKMGRKDGVTKAGGPRSRQPLRATPPSHQRYRSPTPPPIF